MSITSDVEIVPSGARFDERGLAISQRFHQPFAEGNNMSRFAGMVVIVTGAGTGIGAATARRFLSEGASVVLNGRREHKLVETSSGADSAKVMLHPGDVSDEAYVKQLVADTVAKFGRLDVLVNNAGFAIFGPFAELSTEDWRRQIAVDLDGVYFGSREALPHLLATHGSIVNVSSASGLGGDWGGSGYNAAKGAVTNFTRSLALEYAALGVRVNAVAPSLTSTDATTDLEKNEAIMSAFRTRLPAGRQATPEEVAAVILFLASDDASFVNGVILPVDGGLSASNGQPNFLASFE
jgi:meso-butanediol dehydrogenase/(S,S)-butanediol dehydrogenase/diacetyl reductase